jgi:6-phosphogluconolactonase
VPIFAFTGSLTRSAPNYAEANGKGISTFLWNEAASRLEPVAEQGGIDDTAYLLLDPQARRLYTTCEMSGSNQSAVATFSVDAGMGTLTPLGRQPALGNEACHLSLTPSGAQVVVANYNGAVPAGDPDISVSVFQREANGALKPASSSVRHEGEGPNRERQASAHAHCVVPSPDGRFAYVADLGIDAIVTYDLAADGSLSNRRDTPVNPGVGPRHVVFHPNGGLLFMISELIPTVISYKFDAETGALSKQDEYPIASLDGGVVQPAGIITSADGRFIYASLRQSDEILCLRVNGETGLLAHVARCPSGGKTPRDLALTPAGKHLLVTNQDSDTVSVFELNAQNGTPNGPIQQVPVGTPMTIKIAAF